MNRQLQKEISTLVGLAAFTKFIRGHRRSALGWGALALGLRFWPSNEWISYEFKSVVITGGSRGLGLELARQLLQKGALVTLIARDLEELNRAERLLDPNGSGRVQVIVCDVTERVQMKAALSEVESRFGRIDILINNAGAITAGPFGSMNVDDFKAQMELHLYSVVQSTQLALPFFENAGGGRIVNISSIGGKIAVPHMSAYCASKFALSGFSKSVASELHQKNIKITTVYPGLMRTGSPIQAVFKGDHEKEYAWFSTADSLPVLSQPPEQAAAEILAGTLRGESEIVVSQTARWGAFISNHFPEIFSKVLALVSTLLPKGESQVRKTGAQSREWLARQAWSQPLLDAAHEAEEKFNQREKKDPEFNMGLH